VIGFRAVSRPSVDVVVPFAGDAAALARLVERLERLALNDGDTVAVVDNRPPADATPFPQGSGVRCVRAPERQSSYHARNRGAAAGAAAWLVFLDADVDPPADLLDAYFDPAPGERTGALAGSVRDEASSEPVAAGVARHASLGQENTLQRPWAYAQTANCAVRRAAFDAVGGFAGDIRSGGDADLCFRLRASGWELERRPAAAVTHSSRRTLRALAGQRARHGAGAAWLERRWPGAMPARPLRPLLVYFARESLAAVRCLARGERDRARALLVGPTAELAFEAGRRLSNRAPEGRRGWTPLARWLR
jgi:GT2 family glycosyltransferase